MKIPRIRKTTGLPDNLTGYLKFNSYEDSVQDLLLWMDSTGFPNSVQNSAEYVRELKARNYFEDSFSNYLAGVNNALKGLEKKGITGFKISNVWL